VKLLRARRRAQGNGRVLPDQVPVNLVPPCLEILPLAAHSVVLQPHVLPRVDAHERHHVDTTQRLLGALVLPGGRAKGSDLVQRLVRFGVVRVEIVRLAAVVGARQRRAGEVRGQDAQAAKLRVVGLHEPDEAGAEHGLGRGKERLAQRVERRKVLCDLGAEVRRGLRLHVRGGAQAAEEEVVIEGHAGNVEGVGLCGVAGKVDDERLCVLGLPGGAGRGLVELIDYVLLVLGVGRVEALCGEQAGNAVLAQLAVVGERGDLVDGADVGRGWGESL
jgi:hypothetical protein